jgi:hypothetical protein
MVFHLPLYIFLDALDFRRELMLDEVFKQAVLIDIVGKLVLLDCPGER